ncbi:tripartite tricarboxylate transporter TctB family protein [Nonomuraea fuscirosea]|uniref:tripartite tricarboxylate transporter TctB family protein n=1 Tax=Nonomuraea fuscirosea TaxID=1291556 RepID=UPI0034373265
MRGSVKPEVIVAGSLLVLGLLYGVLALGEGLGTMADSGAGFFPLIVALVLAVTSVVVLVQSRRETPGDVISPEAGVGAASEGGDAGDVGDVGDVGAEATAEDGSVGAEVAMEVAAGDGGEVRWWRIAGVLAAALLVPAVGDTVGMVVTLSIALVLMAKIMGISRWSRAVIFGLSFGAATWLIFVRWLAVPLPSGPLGLF